MKRSLIAIMFFGALYSCGPEEPVASQYVPVKFGFSLPTTGRLSEEFDPAAILVTIENEKGEIVINLRKLELFNFSGTYLTNTPLELPTGNYFITQCLVANHQNEITHVVPVIASKKANLVQNPLPIPFSLQKDESKTINLEVVAVETAASDYGYVTFSIGEVSTPKSLNIDFLVPTPDYFVNNGYDSVWVTLTNDDTVIVKKLNILSEDHANGEIMIDWNQIVDNHWTIRVQAFFEVIDEVPDITHTNESILEQEIEFSMSCTAISITWKKITSGSNEYEAIWLLQSHFTDDNGNYKITINNDFCSPRFEYQILKDIDYMFVEKFVAIKDTASFTSQKYLFKELYFIEPGFYYDSTTFQGVCDGVSFDPENILAGMMLSFANTSDFYCYIVWEAINDPNDPYKTARTSSEGSATGAFRVLDPDEFKLIRKN